MTVEEQIHEMGVKARAAATALRAFTTAQKNAALTAIADALDAAKPQIDAANAEDVAAAQANGLAPALVDRLTLLPGCHTRSHSEHGSQGPLRRGYCGTRPRESRAPPALFF